MISKPTGLVSVGFSYTDEFGENTSMKKTVASDFLGGSDLDVVGDLFRDFLLSCGYCFLADKRIKWVEDDR